MAYSYKNDQAPTMYDAFRQRAREESDSSDETSFVDTHVPCLLHPVKASRNAGKQVPASSQTDTSVSQQLEKDAAPLNTSASTGTN
jgi:hypothetical protein